MFESAPFRRRNIDPATAYVLEQIGDAAEYAPGVADATVRHLNEVLGMGLREAGTLVADAPDDYRAVMY